MEAENRRQAEVSAQNEAAIYKALTQPGVPPDIQALAITGLLESAQPRKKKGGLRGWLGELESSTIYPQMQALLSQQVEVEPAVEGRLPSRQIQQVIPGPAPTLAPAAQPAQSPVELGAPPPAQVRYIEALGRAAKPAKMGPRQIFRTPEEQAVLTEEAQARGAVRGRVAGRVEAGFTPAEARELERRQLLGTAPYQAIAGEIIGPDGRATPAFGTFNRATSQWEDIEGRPLTNFRPRPTGGAAASMGTYAERAAGELGYTSAAAARLAGPEVMRRVNERAEQLQAEARGAVVTAGGEAAAGIPLSTQQRFQATTDLQDAWRKADAPLQEMRRNYSNMEVALRRFREGDQLGGAETLRIAFVRMTEPTSVVMPSEYARGTQGLSLTERITGYINRLKEGGGGIPEPEMAAMVETGRQFLAGLQTWNALERQRIEATAKGFGLDPGMILAQQPAVPPAVGTAPPTAPVTPTPPTPASTLPGARRDPVTGKWMLTVP